MGEKFQDNRSLESLFFMLEIGLAATPRKAADIQSWYEPVFEFGRREKKNPYCMHSVGYGGYGWLAELSA
jgi:hypothetical protein